MDKKIRVQKQKIQTGFFQIETCSGRDLCSQSVIDDPEIFKNFIDRIHEICKEKTINDNESKIPFKRFNISISLCPNGCSRPQITDIGLLGAGIPLITESLCNKCGKCITACREKAITLSSYGYPVINDRCLYCSDCIRACPKNAIKTTKTGFRILLGGKLGRHPRLGKELQGIFTLDQSLNIIDQSIAFFISHLDKGKRFGDLIDSEKQDWLAPDFKHGA